MSDPSSDGLGDTRGDGVDGTYYDRPQRGNGCLWAVIGCGGVCLLMLIGVLVAGWFAVRKGPGMLADALLRGAAEGIVEMQLPEDQKQRLSQRLEQLADDVKSGRVTQEQLARIVKRLTTDKPLVAAGILYAIEHHLLTEIDLPPEKEAAANRAVQRVARGVIEGRIALDALEQIAAPILVEKRGGSKEIKPDLQEADIDLLIASCRKAADQAEVPDEPFAIDMAAEFSAIVDQVLGMPADSATQ